MREILFRAKNSCTNEWVYGYVVPVDAAGKIVWTINNTEHIYIAKSETIGQYTGLKDKNGTKIFEGDIMRNAGNVVEFSCGFCINGDSPLSFWTETEIIGNIYDNPELC